MAGSPPADALLAIRAWLRLDQAFTAFNRYLRGAHGVTGAQLAMLRIIGETPAVTLAQLRARLAMHPATLGQLIDRLTRLGLVDRRADSHDRRLRQVSLTAAGRRLLAAAPVAGPVRLRYEVPESTRLRTLAHAFQDAIDLFGLSRWAG